MNTYKKYNNYMEQVKDNVDIETIELDNDISERDEFWFEPLVELISDNVSQETINEYDLDNEDGEGVTGYAYETLESVYQIFKVDILGIYGVEHERLNIFYSEEEESYILPVYHFGTAWTYVGAYNN